MSQAKPQPKPNQVTRPNNQNREIRILVVLGVVAAAILIVATLLFNRSQPEPTALSGEEQALLIREDSPTRGPANAPVTLVEFLDPECEACRAAYPGVERILEDYEGRIRYVVRYFPNHNNSIAAVAATEAAAEQGKYWEMQELLFATQREWGEQETPQTDRFIGYAEQLGLDIETFTASLQNQAYVDKARRDYQDAQALGLRGTPTFFVNGQIVFGMDETSLRNLIEAGL